jgi:hypothetical protein
MSKGPEWTDENGELKERYLSCANCDFRRVHDWHYFYCRDLGDQSKPDLNPYNGGLRRNWSYPHIHKDCRFGSQMEVENG